METSVGLSHSAHPASHEFGDPCLQHQASALVKSFRRKVSEQTTTCSEMTLDEQESYNSNTVYEENLMPYVFLVPNGTMMAGAMCGTGEAIANTATIPMVGMGVSPFGSQTLTNSHQTSTTSALANLQAQQHQSNEVAAVRFCPKCGKKVEPIHSFCPYCCFDLQEIHALSSQAVTTVPQGATMPGVLTNHTQQQSCSPVGGPAPQQPDEMAVVRFCPKCGKKVEPIHSFCPYCCFDLQEIHALDSQAVTTVPQGASTPCVMTSHAQQQSCSLAGGPAPRKSKLLGSETADVLSCVGSFSYIEASTTDIVVARNLVERMMRGTIVA